MGIPIFAHKEPEEVYCNLSFMVTFSLSGAGPVIGLFCEGRHEADSAPT
jgi:hypothetical protein